MKISEIKKTQPGIQVEFLARMCGTQRKPKRDNSSFYLEVSLQDDTDTIIVPIWEDWEKYEIDRKDIVVKVTGMTSVFNGNIQVKVQDLKSTTEVTAESLIPSYEIPNQLIMDFEEIVKNLSEPYKTLLIEATGCLEKDEQLFHDFINYPSAVKHHGNRRGGLFLHEIGVVKAIIYAINSYSLNPFFEYNSESSTIINKDRMIFKGFMHDIGKMQEYDYKDGISRKQMAIDHRALGVAYLGIINERCGNILPEEDYLDISYSILCHHGNYGDGCYPLKTVEDKILHMADMMDSQIVGHLESGKFSD